MKGATLRHAEKVLESLKGKTIIDSVEIGFEGDIDLDAVKDAMEKYSIELTVRGKSLTLTFQQNFLRYVLWNYYSALNDAVRHIKQPLSLRIYAHQLFGNTAETFQLVLNDGGMTFSGRRYIEDTLFLDLQRYCEHNSLNYEVK